MGYRLMTGSVLAEAGFSECAKNAACSADLNREIWLYLAPGIIFVAWVAVSVAATVHIAYSQTVGEWRAGWISAVWLLPFVGSVAWWVSAIRAAWRAHRMLDSRHERVPTFPPVLAFSDDDRS